MLSDGLIPEFHDGQRVLVTPRPNPEFACACGKHLHGEDWPPSFVGVVHEGLRPTRCRFCGHVDPPQEGIYSIETDAPIEARKRRYLAVPYPWLSPLEDES